jgi:hypothetical protein
MKQAIDIQWLFSFLDWCSTNPFTGNSIQELPTGVCVLPCMLADEFPPGLPQQHSKHETAPAVMLPGRGARVGVNLEECADLFFNLATHWPNRAGSCEFTLKGVVDAE